MINKTTNTIVPASKKGSGPDNKVWNIDFGIRLQNQRNKKGLTQHELANKIGADKNTIQNYESGGRPRGDYLVKIANAMECSIDWLLMGFEKESDHERELQVELLQTIIGAIENKLQQQNLELEPDKKAKAIALLYEMYADTKKEVSEQTVVRYLNLVA